MIQADGKKFILQGKNYSYAMYVVETGFLRRQDYGKRSGVFDSDRRYECAAQRYEHGYGV